MGTAGDGFDLVRDWRCPVGWKDEEKKPNLGLKKKKNSLTRREVNAKSGGD